MYYVFWGLAIGGYDDGVCSHLNGDVYRLYYVKDSHVKDMGCIFTLLALSIWLDTYTNRKFLRKWGAKIFMGSDTRETFKCIKDAQK